MLERMIHAVTKDWDSLPVAGEFLIVRLWGRNDHAGLFCCPCGCGQAYRIRLWPSPGMAVWTLFYEDDHTISVTPWIRLARCRTTFRLIHSRVECPK